MHRLRGLCQGGKGAGRGPACACAYVRCPPPWHGTACAAQGMRHNRYSMRHTFACAQACMNWHCYQLAGGIILCYCTGIAKWSSSSNADGSLGAASGLRLITPAGQTATNQATSASQTPTAATWHDLGVDWVQPPALLHSHPLHAGCYMLFKKCHWCCKAPCTLPGAPQLRSGASTGQLEQKWPHRGAHATCRWPCH